MASNLGSVCPPPPLVDGALQILLYIVDTIHIFDVVCDQPAQCLLLSDSPSIRSHRIAQAERP